MLNKDKSTATITSSIGVACGTPKFHITTAINQIKKNFIDIIISLFSVICAIFVIIV